MERSDSVASHGPDAEARLATVLKCDLVGSTGAKKRLDLDGQLAFQRGFEQVVTDVAMRHSAHIETFEGDGALIVFGFPDPREDAADSAVRMGLELVDAMRAAEIAPDMRLQLRVGIASGLIAIVKRPSGPKSESIAGLTVDMAERLRALAASVDPEETASASGLLNFIRTVSGAFGTSIANTVWENGATRNQADLAGTLNDAQSVIDGLTASGMSHDQAVGAITQIVQGQAIVLSTNQLFMGCAALFLAAAVTIWLAPKPTRLTGPSLGH